MSKHPTRLKNPPIIESIVEIRFNSSLPNEVVFGVFYSLIKDRYNEIEELNTAKIPKEIIEKEETLKFAPHYVLRSKEKSLMLMIGPKVLVFKYQKHQNSTILYPGWHDYMYKEIIDTLSQLTGQGYIKEVLRIGLRAIDFIEEDIFGKLKLSISMTGRELNKLEKSFRFNIKEDDFNNTIAISNSSLLMIKGQPNKGSTIDIDTSSENKITENIQDYLSEVIKNGHEVNKDLFFSLLKDEYIIELENR